MASRTYKRAASFAKKAAKPPAKTVVFSLVAFLIVAAAPWLIIQTDAVVDDGAKISYDLEDGDYQPYIGVWYYTLSGSSSDTRVDLTVPFEIVVIDSTSFFVDFDELYAYSDLTVDKSQITDWQYNLYLLNEEGEKLTDFDMIEASESVTKVVLSTPAQYRGFTDGVYEISRVDSLKYTFSHCQVNGTDEVVEFTISYFEDDYTGTIIAFIAGVGLVILAVLSTNLVNPTRWGKRRN